MTTGQCPCGQWRRARGEASTTPSPWWHGGELHTRHGGAAGAGSTAGPRCYRNPSFGCGSRVAAPGWEKNKSPWRGRRRTDGASIPPQHGGGAGRSTPGTAGDGEVEGDRVRRERQLGVEGERETSTSGSGRSG